MASLNYHGRKLLRELKRLREQTGMTRDDASGELRIPSQKLSRIENGQLPKYHETRAMLKLYTPEPEHWAPYLDLWELAKKRGWWQQYGLQDSSYVSMEQEAATMTEFQLGLLPELLQTDRYARASLAYHDDGDTRATVRIRRQQRLFSKENPLTMHTLIHEPALHQAVDQQQLLQLLERAQMPNITLQVVPQTAGMHDGLNGSVILLGFDDPREPDLAFTETLLGVAYTRNEDKTSSIRALLRNLAELAMSPEDSLDMVKSLIS